MGYLGYIPAEIRRDMSLSPSAKVLYAEITANLGVNGRMKFSLHRLALMTGFEHWVVKDSLNALAKRGHIYRIDKEISIFPPQQEDMQIDLDLDFNKELVRIWNKTFENELTKGYLLTDNIAGAINKCLDSYSKDDLVSAIPKWRDFCKQDKFWGAKDKVNLKVNLLRFLQDDNRIQQAMNFNPKATGDTFNVRDEKQDGNLLK
jgi:hypothetical protein